MHHAFFLVHFLVIVARLRRETSSFHGVLQREVNERKRFRFSFSELRYSGPLVFSSRKIRNILQIKRGGTRAISLKQCEFFFLSEVLAAVAVVHVDSSLSSLCPSRTLHIVIQCKSFNWLEWVLKASFLNYLWRISRWAKFTQSVRDLRNRIK